MDDAIIYYQSGLDLCPPGHPGRASSLSNLANALQTRFDQFGNLSDLNEAIFNHRGTLDLTEPAHPYRAACLTAVANALLIHLNRIVPEETQYV